MIDVKLINLDQDLFGFHLTAKCIINYRVYSTKDKRVFYDKIISASNTATTSDAISGEVRLKIATANAVKSNISQFMVDLNQLPVT